MGVIPKNWLFLRLCFVLVDEPKTLQAVSVALVPHSPAMSNTTKLKAEFDYYVENQDELVAKYRGKFLVIKNRTVIGTYSSDLEAITETIKTEPMGTFLVQKAEPGKQNYTQTFHSRVVLA